MSRLTPIAPEAAVGRAKELLDAVQAKLGMTPNISRTLAHAPAALEGYVAFSGALGKGRLSTKDRERIALTVAQASGCDYCLAAHGAIGERVGLTLEQIRDSRRGKSTDPRSDALLRFARRVVDQRGNVTDDDLQAVRRAGVDDGALVEVVANVALNLFTNYFNHVAATEVDFPPAEPLDDHVRPCATGVDCDASR